MFIWGHWCLEKWLHSIVSSDNSTNARLYSESHLQPCFVTTLACLFSLNGEDRMKPSFISVILGSAVLLGSQDFSSGRKMSLKSKDKMTSDMGWFCNFLGHKVSSFCTPLSSLDTPVMPWCHASRLSVTLSVVLWRDLVGASRTD